MAGRRPQHAAPAGEVHERDVLDLRQAGVRMTYGESTGPMLAAPDAVARPIALTRVAR